MHIAESFLSKMIPERRKNSPNKLNAPNFIYSILYGKTSNVRGRIDHEAKLINGVAIDAEIPTKSMVNLMRIKEIIPRSSCQGENKDRPTFFIFLPKNQNEEYIAELVNKLNLNNNVKAGYEVGNMGKFRVGVTWYTWYGHKDFNMFWNSLPSMLLNAIKG